MNGKSSNITGLFVAVILCTGSLAPFPVYAGNDDEIRQKIIADSIAHYPGNCPCPYNTDRAGRACGRRSAYVRAGGYATVCYPQDVTQDMIQTYRKRRG